MLLGAPGASAPAAAEEPSDAPEEAPLERRFFFDLGWDDGPTYEIGQTLPILGKLVPGGYAREVRVKGRFGASLYLDGGYRAGSTLLDGFQGTVRRSRFSTRGQALVLVPTEYKFEFAVEDQEVYLNDFFLRWRPPRFVDTLRFGYFDPPVSLEALMGSADRSLMETPAPVSAFAPGYRLGVEVTRAWQQPSLNLTLNLSSLGQSQPNAEATSASVLRAVGRLAWRPLGASDGRGLVHLGGSLSQIVSGSGDLQYRARAESFLNTFLVDTGNLDGDASVLGLEAAWRRGPLSLEAEYLRAFVESDDEGSLGFEGSYLQLSWALTGESRPYDAAAGVFGRIEPSRPYKPFRGQWGALELAARAAWLDLSDDDVRGGRMLTANVGPSWTWNRWVRFHLGYVYARVSDSPRGTHGHIAQARVELRL